jgi:hypothetical protein
LEATCINFMDGTSILCGNPTVPSFFCSDQYPGLCCLVEGADICAI